MNGEINPHERTSYDGISSSFGKANESDHLLGGQLFKNRGGNFILGMTATPRYQEEPSSDKQVTESAFAPEEELPEGYVTLGSLTEVLDLNVDKLTSLLSQLGITIRQTPSGEVRLRDGVHPSVITQLEGILNPYKQTKQDLSQEEGETK